MKKQKIYDVVICGMGPTGLILANSLGIRGHEVLVLEREPKFYGNARAVYTDDECMRIYQSIDLDEVLQKDMLVDTPAQLVHGDGTPMITIRDLDQPFGWPLYNFFYQPYMETTLAKGLERFPNVTVLRGREVVEFDQDDEGVTVSHNATQSYRYSDETDVKAEGTGNLDTQVSHGKYLIGADGGRSVVRMNLGIDMTGKNFPEPWLVVDLKQKEGEDGLRHIPYFNFYCDPALPAVSCPQPDGYHRFEFMLQKGQTKEYMEKPSTVRQMISKYVDPDKFEVKRKLVYTFNALMANKWREGRFILAGDAAHMTPQFMGQGMSSGVRDAYNLAWKLSLVLNGKAGDQLLDTYESERRAHAKAMIDVSVWLKDMVSMKSPVGAVIRNSAVAATLSTPIAKDWLKKGGVKPKPVYKRGKYFGAPRKGLNGPEGRLCPQPLVRKFNGKRVRLDHILGEGFALVGYGIDPRDKIAAEHYELLDSLSVSFTALYSYPERPQGMGAAQAPAPGLVEVEDLEGRMVEWFKKAGYKPGAVAIVRPDKYCYGVAQNGDINKLLAGLQASLNAPLAEAA